MHAYVHTSEISGDPSTLPKMGLPTIEVQVEVGHGERKRHLRGRGKCWGEESLGMTKQHMDLIVDRQKHLPQASSRNLSSGRYRGVECKDS